MRFGDGLHGRHHQPVAAGLIGLAQAGIERAAVVTDHQRGVAAAQHVGHVHALRLQFSQATGFGFSRGITTTVRRWPQGVQMETAGNEIEQAQGHCAASLAVLLQPGALPFDDDGLNHDVYSFKRVTAPEGP